MQVRTRILLLVLSVLIPSFVAAGLATLFVYTEQQEAQRRGVGETTRALALMVDSELQSKASLLRTLAASPALARDDLAVFYSHARQLAPSPQSAIVLSDPGGHQLLNTRQPLGTQLPQRRHSNLGQLMRGLGADRMLVSDLFLAPLPQRHEFAVQVPVKRGDQVSYFLALGLDAALMAPLVNSRELRDEMILTITDRNGLVVARSRSGDRFLGKPIRERTRKLMAENLEGEYDSVTLDGEQVRAFYSTVPSADWKVVLSIPKSAIRRVPLHAAALLGVAMAVLLGAGSIAASWLAKRAIRPIDYLGRAARQLGEGRALVHEPQGVAEIDAVSQQMAQASIELSRSRQHLEQRVAEAVATTERAQGALLKSQKLEALGRLTGGIAHEFNNLLQTLTTGLRAVEMTTTQPQVRSLVQTCMRTVNRAAVLTGQLGSFGRQQEARLVTVEVAAQVNSAVQLVRGVLGAGIELRVECGPRLWPVTVEPLQFELALLNLAINARDAMPHGGLLRIEACNATPDELPGSLVPGDYVRIAVVDNGTGMPPDVLARAADPFFTTKPQGQGTGLGLAQAYGFANQSQGRLQIESAPGAGTRVEIWLPRAFTRVAAVAAGDARSAPLRGHGLVLFVDDDPLVREAVAPALQACGFSVLLAEDGESAMRMLDDGARPDVVFSDIVMTGQIGGIELARMVRERYPALRVVLASGYTEQQASLPGVRVLAKPYAIEEVVEALLQPAENG
jgi:signal transduction histidine kinase/CheY-like chemotaxis protein